MPSTCYRLSAAVAAAFILVSLFSAPSAAQVPSVAIYFDEGLTMDSQDCQGIGTIDTLYVTMLNVNDWISAIELRVDYTPVTAFTFLADQSTTPLVIGNSSSGIALTWQIPQSGFTPLVVFQSVIVWNCDTCAGFEGQVLEVKPHPQTGHIRAVQYPNQTFIDLTGLSAAICLPFPVETTSWGRLKALYEP